jgi:hypothetical protein
MTTTFADRIAPPYKLKWQAEPDYSKLPPGAVVRVANKNFDVSDGVMYVVDTSYRLRAVESNGSEDAMPIGALNDLVYRIKVLSILTPDGVVAPPAAMPPRQSDPPNLNDLPPMSLVVLRNDEVVCRSNSSSCWGICHNGNGLTKGDVLDIGITAIYVPAEPITVEMMQEQK